MKKAYINHHIILGLFSLLKFTTNLFRTLTLVAVLLATGQLMAAEIVSNIIVDSATTKIELSPHIEILIDESNLLTIDDVTNKHSQPQFKPVADIGNSFGFSKANYWVRLSIKVDDSVTDTLLLHLDQPTIDTIVFFPPDGKGGFERRLTGDNLPHANREIAHRTFLFKLPQHQGEIRTYYLQLKTKGSMQIPLTLWTTAAFIDFVDTSNLILGGYYGIMLLLVLISAASFAKSRDKLFLFYGLYLLSYLLFQFSLNGLSYQYFWPELPQWTSQITSASVSLVVVGALLFSGYFLQIWSKKYFYLKWLFYILILSGSINIFMSLFGDFSTALQRSVFLGIFLAIVVLVAAVASIISGYKPARYFAVAWLFFLLGVFVLGLLNVGLLPATFLTTNAMQIGSLLEVILLGYALIMRFDQLRIDKEQATSKALELRELVDLDGMTGLLNHNASIDYLEKMKYASERYGRGLVVIMLDIDFFKSINDNFGHPVGDMVIIAIANILKDAVRDSDGAGRYGGEEFILILPEIDLHNAEKLAERLRQQIMQLALVDIDNTTVTASFGIAAFDSAYSGNDLIVQADSALYRAKEGGRNRIVIFNS